MKADVLAIDINASAGNSILACTRIIIKYVLSLKGRDELTGASAAGVVNAQLAYEDYGRAVGRAGASDHNWIFGGGHLPNKLARSSCATRCG